MSKISKRRKTLDEKNLKQIACTLEEAAAGVKTCATAKFDETVELAFTLGVDPRHADQMVRGTVSLPHGTGKQVRVVVFCKETDQINAAKEAGAIDMMRDVGKLGKVLGPRGLMPSPKAGTVTPKVGDAVAEILKGKIDFRVDKNANIHVPIGKASFTAEQIQENASAVIDAVVKARPSACKGVYLKSCCMSSTMGPGFRLDAPSLVSQFRV